ncbi:MAG: DNA polymerase-3 subunit epsilon [Arenicella sp.]
MLTTLPEKYYLSHALELFDFVEKQCSVLLDQADKDYLQGFSRLSSNGQCLLVRFLTRKPQFLKRNSLQYPEIENIDSAIDELIHAGMLSTIRPGDWSKFLPTMTKPEILGCFEVSSFQVKASSSKAVLVEFASNCFDGSEPELLAIRERYLARRHQQIIDYILFLFFGDLNNRFQKFAMRDLAVLKTRAKSHLVSPRFTTKKDAQDVFKLLLHKRQFRATPSQVKQQVAEYLLNSDQVPKIAQATRDKLALEVGIELLADNPVKAIELWRASNDPKATQRWIRESYKSQDRDLLKQELQELRLQALPAAKRVFIEDFYARKYQGQRTSIYTKMLREADTVLDIDESFINDVEYGVIALYQQQGQVAYFTENHHWRVLFGLTFWSLLFGNTQVQHNQFDLLPVSLKDASFHIQNRDAIKSALSLFDSPEIASQHLAKVATRYYGSPNGIFSWSGSLLDSIQACLHYAPAGAIAKVLLAMAKDYLHCKDGYPDLMITDNQALRFEEIKAPGDTLRANQLLSINRLREAGFEVGLSQVRWATNPDQVYAVVDIETTGSSKNSSSITEIAVVRMRGSKVIGEWSSLVNPMRDIPAHITRLTGISNHMAESAPVFEQIADQLLEQLDGGIFVAHNVGFDYGFVKSAFERMGVNFRMPKYCTVVNSRKAFPGLKSYSLGNLTQHFDIDLYSHHRALSDAKATANLLCLIHEAGSP